MVSLIAALTVFATVDEAAISGLKHAAAICDPRSFPGMQWKSRESHA